MVRPHIFSPRYIHFFTLRKLWPMENSVALVAFSADQCRAQVAAGPDRRLDAGLWIEERDGSALEFLINNPIGWQDKTVPRLHTMYHIV